MDFLNKVCRYPAIDWITDNRSQVLKNGAAGVARLVAEALRQVKSDLGKDTDAAKAADRLAKDVRLSSYSRFPNVSDKVADTASCIALAVAAWLVEKLPSVRATDMAMNLFGRAADMDGEYYDRHDFMSILDDYDDEGEAFINDFVDSDDDAFEEETTEEDDAPKETYTNKYSNNFEAGSNPIVLQDAKIKIDHFEANGIGDLNSKIREKVKEATNKSKVDNHQQEEAGSPLMDRDERVKAAIKVVQSDPQFRFDGDWAWIKKVMEDKPIDEKRSAGKFNEYMSGLGAMHMPSKSTINRNITKISLKKNGFYEFSDTSDHDEIQRRNNIMKEFVAAFTKYKKQ